MQHADGLSLKEEEMTHSYDCQHQSRCIVTAVGAHVETYSSFLSSQVTPTRLPSFFNTTWRTLVALHWRMLILQAFWTSCEVACRLATPVALRYFLLWLQEYGQGLDPPPYRGWLLALAIGAGGFSTASLHHQLFWFGMKSG
jgi:hypothetical protein